MKSLPELLHEKSPEHHTRYAYIKQIARTGFQEHATQVGYLTNHGPQHYQNLEANLDFLLPDDVKNQLAVEEIFLLLCAVHFHDVGLLSEKYPEEPWTAVRKDHVNRTYDYIHEYYEDWGLIPSEAYPLKNICLGHSGDTLYELPEEALIHNARIRIHFLAALLRIADELDLDYTRVSPTIMRLKKISDESLKHWIKHRDISGVLIDSRSWTIEVQAMPTNEVSKAIIEDLVERKVQKELEYVHPIFEKYNLYYRQVIVKYVAFGNKRSANDQPRQSKPGAHALDEATQEHQVTSTPEAQQQPPVEKYVPPPTPGPSAPEEDLDEDDISRLTQDLIASPQSVFDNVIATYRPPSGAARSGSIPSRAEELVRIAKIRGDLLKLRNAYYSAIGISPPPLKKKLNPN